MFLSEMDFDKNTHMERGCEELSIPFFLVKIRYILIKLQAKRIFKIFTTKKTLCRVNVLRNRRNSLSCVDPAWSQPPVVHCFHSGDPLHRTEKGQLHMTIANPLPTGFLIFPDFKKSIL